MSPPRRSKIGYTDYSGNDLNFVLGCTPVSEGCRFCYSKAIYDRFGKDFSQVTVYPEKLERLLKWQPKPPYKRGPGSRPLAFVVDMGDLFHEDVPDDLIYRFLDVAHDQCDIDWLVLTKRAKRMSSLMGLRAGHLRALPNIWLGVTVEDKDNLWRLDELRRTPAAVRWVSLEPMLEPIALRSWLICNACGGTGDWDFMGCPVCLGAGRGGGIDWVIIGAESGPNRRPFKKEWAWDVLDQCGEAGVACFLKQDSGLRPGVPLLDRDGKEVKQFPPREGGDV